MSYSFLMQRSVHVKRAIWFAGAYFAVYATVFFTGGVGICGPRLPMLVLLACPAGLLFCIPIFWNAFKGCDDANWDRLSLHALIAMIVAASVFCFSALMALISL
jgi:hypothetical protein